MKRLSILCFIFCLGAFAAAAATKSAHPAGGLSLTGCLQKGDEPNTLPADQRDRGGRRSLGAGRSSGQLEKWTITSATRSRCTDPP